MKTNRILVLIVLLMAAVGFTAGAAGITLLADAPVAPTPPLLGQPGSLIEVYGVIDAALRFSTNATSSGANYIGSSQGLFQGSRLGFRGTEDIGGNFKAIYTLELGVILPYGYLDQQGVTSTGVGSGQLFGRQAWVGVSSADYGRLTFGRTYGTFSDVVGAGDVFGVNHGNAVYANGTNDETNDAVNGFFQQEMGFRWDNSFKYEGSFSGVTVGAQAALGNVTGNEFLYNSMFAGSIGYGAKGIPLSGAIGIQNEQDPAGNFHTNFGLGAKYAFDATDAVYAFYFHSVYNTGFTRISNNNSEFSGTMAQGRQDDIANLAVNYYVMPSLNLIAAYYFDYAQNVAAAGDNGMRNSILASADYFFTKDVDVYLAGWWTVFSGSLANTKNGGAVVLNDSNAGTLYPLTATSAGNSTSLLTVMLGMRFRF
jgi:predicted porin